MRNFNNIYYPFKSLKYLFIINFLILLFFNIFKYNSFSGNGAFEKNSILFVLNNRISRETQLYLGTIKNNSITINDIKASLIIIEVFNTYCTNCPKNIKQLNEVFLHISNNENLNRHVKIIGIAPGNNEKELNEYKKLYNIKFPIFTDYDFRIHKSLGNPRVPYTLFIKKLPNNQNKISFIHQGNFKSSDEIIQKLNTIITN